MHQASAITKPHYPKPHSRWSLLFRVSMASLLSFCFLSLLFLLSLSPASPTEPTTNSRRRRPLAPSPSPKVVPAPAVVRQACKATRFPDSCASSLSKSPSRIPNLSTTDLILAAVSVSAQNLKTAQSMAQSVLHASSGNPNRSNAARNCVEHLGYSDRRLSRTAGALPRGRIKDARAWASAALLYQYDCYNALHYVNGTKQVDDAMRFLLSLTHQTSNALSMLAAYERFGNNTAAWVPPQTERDGYWGDDAVEEAGGLSEEGAFKGGFPWDLPAPDAKVCKGGGNGCYRTVQEAVDAAPEYGARRFVIYIKEGVYQETVRVPFEKTHVVFVGDGMGKTVITGSLHAQMVGVSTYNTASVGVNGDGFMAKGLTFENTAGPVAYQAVAFRSDSDLSVLEEVEFLGHQDTLYAHSLRQLYKSCRVAGTVDFVFGNSAAVFQDCLLLVRPRQVSPQKGETNAVTAQGRTDPAQATGFVFRNCVVNGTGDYMGLYRRKPAAHRNYLGRPWKEYSRTVLVRCRLEALVRPEGWLPWRGDFALKTLFYGEFESTGAGANPAARVAWSNQIPAAHVGVYSARSFIQGNEWIPVSTSS
uniref:Pectinesterase n=1 Tax=Anthurium amnicola TaxID=1678845 RepID=A0A1D1Z2T3_9ARAE